MNTVTVLVALTAAVLITIAWRSLAERNHTAAHRPATNRRYHHRFALAPRQKRDVSRESHYYQTAVTNVDCRLLPDDYFDKIVQLILTNFWGSTDAFIQAVAREARPFQTLEEAALAARRVLCSLGDPATFLFDCLQSKENEAWTSTRGAVTCKLEGGIGYLSIACFDSQHVVEETSTALTRLEGASAFVLDLRDNPGGYLLIAARIFALFADEGELARIEGRRGEAFWLTSTSIVTEISAWSNKLSVPNKTSHEEARRHNMTHGRPLIVLVDGGTASAAEMLAAALRECRGAKIVGGRTRGKWTNQLFWLLDCGTSLAITVARRVPEVEGGLRPCYELPCDEPDWCLRFAIDLARSRIEEGELDKLQ